MNRRQFVLAAGSALAGTTGTEFQTMYTTLLNWATGYLGKSIAIAAFILGAGIGIGNIFGSMIQAVARQPELKGELTGIQWLGFALTEAVVFYGLIGGLLAYVLV